MQQSIKSPEYLEQFNFEYAEVYSVFRKPDFLAKMDELNELDERESSQLSTDELELQKELDELLPHSTRLINEDGNFHPEGELTHTFKKDDPMLDKLREILSTPYKEQHFWMCAPIYRDVVVFYDQADKIVSVLYVCLGCDHVEDDQHTFILTDHKAHELLQQYFTDLGHRVELDELYD